MTVVTNNTIQPSSGQALTIKDEGGTASITVATNGEATFAENIIIGTAGHGITFGGDPDSRESSATEGDRTLYDYEQGTFSATTSGITIGTNNTLAYTKIGRVVFIQGRLDFTGDPGSGEFYINNFPFASGSSTTMAEGAFYPTFNVQINSVDTILTGTVATFMTAGSTSARFRDAGGVTGASGSMASHIDNGSILYISGHYFVD